MTETTTLLSPATLLAELSGCEFDVVRVRAVQALRDIGAADQAAALLAALDDEDEDVREDAAEALGRLGLQEAIPALLQHLKEDPCGDVKLAALKALSALKAKEAAPFLRELVPGRPEDMVWSEDSMHQDEWDDWLDVQIAAIEALGQIGDEAAVEPIVMAIYDEEGQEIGPVATRALARIGEASLPALSVLLKSVRRRLRLHALTALIDMQRSSEVRAMIETALDDADVDIRLLAFAALLQSDLSEALLQKALNDKAAQVRVAALAQLDLNDAVLIDRVMHDPASEVQLAMIDRLDLSQRLDTSARAYGVLRHFAENGQCEVAARAFAALAALATDDLREELAALFSDEMAEEAQRSDAVEQKQWATVDALARSGDPDAVEILQRATRSPYRAVRLKALAALGQAMKAAETPEVNRQQIRELMLSFALPVVALSEVTGGAVASSTEDVEAPAEVEDDREAIAEAGLDISTAVDAAKGPTSSLGAILGHDDIARQVTEEAAAEDNADPLSPAEQRLLARATRNLSRRKISLENDAENQGLETRLTALTMLGDMPGQQPLLCTLCKENDLAAAGAAARALVANIARFGLAEPGDMAPVIAHLMASSEAALRLAGLHLLQLVPGLSEIQSAQLRRLLKDGDAPVRGEALACALAKGLELDLALARLQDPSSLVRQKAIRLIAQYAPDLAAEQAVGFLKDNPEQNLSDILPAANHAGVSQALMLHLRDRDERQFWPVMISALSALACTETPEAA